METPLSRSEKKRRVQGLEDLAAALVALTAADITRLPCDDWLKEEIRNTAPMQAGARKRQIKYIAKQIRQTEFEPLFAFLEEHKGSRLKQNKILHELERFRDDIITEVLAAMQDAEGEGHHLNPHWHGAAMASAAQQFPTLDKDAIQTAAIRYAKSRKTTYSREIFRLLYAAMERQHYTSAE